jgi:hypothetical protein
MAFTGNYTCDTFKTGLLNGDFDFAVDTFKIALYTNAAALNQNTEQYTTDGEVVAPGYVAGGEVLVPSVGSQGGISYVSFSNASWNAALTARGALVYKEGGSAVFVLDFGADRTSTGVFTVQFPPATSSSAILRIL